MASTNRGLLVTCNKKTGGQTLVTISHYSNARADAPVFLGLSLWKDRCPGGEECLPSRQEEGGRVVPSIFVTLILKAKTFPEVTTSWLPFRSPWPKGQVAPPAQEEKGRQGTRSLQLSWSSRDCCLRLGLEWVRTKGEVDIGEATKCAYHSLLLSSLPPSTPIPEVPWSEQQTHSGSATFNRCAKRISKTRHTWRFKSGALTSFPLDCQIKKKWQQPAQQ